MPEEMNRKSAAAGPRSAASGPPRRSGYVLNLYKQLGETPRERLERLRVQKPEYAREVLSYAGRLDPMAEGVLLCLAGSANKNREAYLEFDKEYMVDVLFGFSTDTYDILGRVMDAGDPAGLTKHALLSALARVRGRVSQEYPPFSSKTVDGRSLIEWARSGALGTIMLPRKTVNIYDIELAALYKIPEQDLLYYIRTSVGKVEGDFRQEEVLTGWERVLREKGDREFPAATLRIACSSGTYARSIAHGLGADLSIPALALHILRTKVGEYTIGKSLR